MTFFPYCFHLVQYVIYELGVFETWWKISFFHLKNEEWKAYICISPKTEDGYGKIPFSCDLLRIVTFFGYDGGTITELQVVAMRVQGVCLEADLEMSPF